MRDRAGQMLEQWGRASQALRFNTEREAQAIARTFQTNSHATSYDVVHLLPPKRGAEVRDGCESDVRDIANDAG